METDGEQMVLFLVFCNIVLAIISNIFGVDDSSTNFSILFDIRVERCIKDKDIYKKTNNIIINNIQVL